jgi:hypothetical protein
VGSEVEADHPRYDGCEGKGTEPASGRHIQDLFFTLAFCPACQELECISQGMRPAFRVERRLSGILAPYEILEMAFHVIL